MRKEIASEYRPEFIEKSDNNQIVDVSSSMIKFLVKLPIYIAPSVSNQQVVCEVRGVRSCTKCCVRRQN